jgi:HK97 family phage major capsid protein
MLRKQIDALTKKRNAHLDAMSALSELASTDDRHFTAEESAAFDKDQVEVRDIDTQLVKLEEAEAQMARTARPAPDPLRPIAEVRAQAFKPDFKGQAFTRFVGALALSKGNLMQAVELAKRWDNEMPEIGAILRHAVTVGSTSDPQWVQRAAVAAGTTVSPTWAAPLINYQLMTQEFIELLRAATIFGRLNYRSIPFNIKIPRQTAGATANWVGEGLSKPVSSLAFDTITVPWAKIAVIVVITNELARFSNPSAEQLVRDDLVATIAAFIDKQLIDPAVTAAAGLRPASITNGVTPIPSTGGTVATIVTDFSKAMLQMSTALGSVGSPVWIMSATAAMYLATVRTAQDIFAFPGMVGAVGGNAQTAGGLSLMGIPVIVSNHLVVTAGKSDVVLLDQSQLMVADDGQVVIDTSTEAALQLDSAPATPPTPLVSLWQQNMLGIKAERYIYWVMRRTGAVQLITGFPGP